MKQDLRRADQPPCGVDDAERAERRRCGRRLVPDADPFEKGDRPREKRRGASVGTGAFGRNQGDGIAEAVEEEGGGEADRPGAGDDDRGGGYSAPEIGGLQRRRAIRPFHHLAHDPCADEQCGDEENHARGDDAKVGDRRTRTKAGQTPADPENGGAHDERRIDARALAVDESGGGERGAEDPVEAEAEEGDDQAAAHDEGEARIPSARRKSRRSRGNP